jgi:hypothetical protein
MRFRGPATLRQFLLVACVSLAFSSCAFKPNENPPAASRESECGELNPLHMVSSSEPKHAVDPETESLLTQQVTDPRLTRLNMQLYQSLHALDVELHREQVIAACKQPVVENPTLEAQATSGDGSGASSPTPQTGLVAAAATSGSAGQMSSMRKASVPPSAAGGNGATAPKIVPGSDNDIVARRLRKAAEQERDPALRKKLWKEYRDYQQGTAAAK